MAAMPRIHALPETSFLLQLSVQVNTKDGSSHPSVSVRVPRLPACIFQEEPTNYLRTGWITEGRTLLRTFAFQRR